MKTSALVATLQAPESTIRKYAHEYADYLSPAGAPGAGRHRDYTEHDVRVLKLIIDMKRQNVSSADIETTLSSLQAGGWERLPQLDETAKSIIPAPGAQIAAQVERSAMQREIDILREMLDKATSDRDELLERLHRAETLLELYQQGRLKPEQPPQA